MFNERVLSVFGNHPEVAADGRRPERVDHEGRSCVFRESRWGKDGGRAQRRVGGAAGGLKGAVPDVDPLHSAAEVLKGRPEAASLLIERSATKLFVIQQACRARECDLLILDTPTTPERHVVLAINVAT